MSMFSKSVLAAMISFSAVNAFADTLINCVGVKNNTVHLSYTVSANPSKRLRSDITFSKNGSSTLISSLSIAQYASTNVLLYLLADDGVENVSLRFTAAPISKTSYLGSIEELGASPATNPVKCTASQI